ncbi:MAG: helix-turn-helix domain-containing protein [Candidatus Omnitrophica bacterium]|nr:helix-turn-helix domain-containing protein [Candidatus Omnitrophota bacterium]
MSAHVLIGSIEKKKKYIKELKKDKRIEQLDIHGDLTIELVKKSKSELDLEVYDSFYNPEIIFVKPAFVDEDGWEYYEIGSWNRKAIEKIIGAVKKNYESKLLKFINTKNYDLYLPKILPDLSIKQKEAISLAIKEGYYEFPKKTELKKLAEISKISFSTFREHLKKAENKLIPLMHKEYIITAK